MSKDAKVLNQKDEGLLNEKLDDIRRRLGADPTKEELNAMQLQMDVLEKWTGLLKPMMMDAHHHDHMDDHDHSG